MKIKEKLYILEAEKCEILRQCDWTKTTSFSQEGRLVKIAIEIAKIKFKLKEKE